MLVFEGGFSFSAEKSWTNVHNRLRFEQEAFTYYPENYTPNKETKKGRLRKRVTFVNPFSSHQTRIL